MQKKEGDLEVKKNNKRDNNFQWACINILSFDNASLISYMDKMIRHICLVP